MRLHPASVQGGDGQCAAGGPEPDLRGAQPTGLLRRARALCQIGRQIAGIPDYDRYLAHMAEHHAGEAVLSREAFFAQAIDRKYGRSGPTCC